jgi:Uma2 family endonuclease
MASKPRPLLRLQYEKAADAYLKSLPPEHFMEATEQATQRKITVASFDLVHARRPEVQCFNELLIQYPRPGQSRLGQVVPDNMVVVHPEPIRASGSYDMPFQPGPPLLVLEYVSKHNERKDYDVSFEKYERGLKVPYYLIFYPDTLDLNLFRLTTRRRYSSVTANGHERLPIPPLEMEVALLDGWVRYWFRGELLPLPGDLLRDLDEARRRLAEANRQVETERRAREAAEEESARLRAELERLRGGA